MVLVRIFRFVVICLVISQLILPQQAAMPGWWTDDSGQTRIIAQGGTPSNTAPANLGQLKYVAAQAKKYLDMKLAVVGGAGAEINALVAGFEPRAGQNYNQEQLAAFQEANCAPINVGQLKAVAKPFYSRLLAVGYKSRYNLIAHGAPAGWAYDYPWDPTRPWNQAGATDKTPNFQMANLAQLKMAFCFDLVSDTDGNFLPINLVGSTETGMSDPNAHPGRLGNGGNTSTPPTYGTPSAGGGGVDTGVDPDHDAGDGVVPPTLWADTTWDAPTAATLHWTTNQGPALSVEYQRKDGSAAWSDPVSIAGDGDGGDFPDPSSLLANLTTLYRLRVTYEGGVVLYSNIAEAPLVPVISQQLAKDSSITRNNPGIRQFTASSSPQYYLEMDINASDYGTTTSDDGHSTTTNNNFLQDVTLEVDPMANNGAGSRSFTSGHSELHTKNTDDRSGVITNDAVADLAPPNYLWNGSDHIKDVGLDGTVSLDQTNNIVNEGEPPFSGGGGGTTVVTATSSSTTSSDGSASSSELLSEPYTLENFLGDTVEVMPDYGDWMDAAIAGGAYRSLASDNSSITLTKQEYEIFLNPSVPATHNFYVIFTSDKGVSQVVGSPHQVTVGNTGGVCGPFEIDPSAGPGDFVGAHLNGSYTVVQGLEMVATATIEDNSVVGGEVTSDLDLNERASGVGIIEPGKTGFFDLRGGAGFSGMDLEIQITNAADFIIVDEFGHEVHDGDVVPYSDLRGPFTVYPKSTATNGEKVSITFAEVVAGGGSLGQDTVVFTMKLSPILSPPAKEVSGTRYRKIGLNGRPLADSKPQRTTEADQGKVETYIDALTLGLRYQSSDIFVPIAGSDLALAVRRNLIGETWNMSNGLRPHERPDRPFGAGWASTVCVTEEFVDVGQEESYVLITDENGAQHRFFHYHQSNSDGSSTDGYAPFPSDSKENGDFLCTLSGDGSVFTDRYGTTITFDYTQGVFKSVTSVTYGDSVQEGHAFYPAATVMDRYGNTLTFTYPGSSLIPTTITYSGGVNQTISIAQDSAGHITSIWDPNGRQYSFGYAPLNYSSGDTQYTETVLTSVIAPDGAVILYNYDFSTENDLTPADMTNGHPIPKLHLDLTSITDANQKPYVFTYDYDHTKLFYRNGQSFPETGLPRYVTSITLPDNLGKVVTFSFQDSQIGVAYDAAAGHVILADGTHKTVQVKDANDNIIVYAWSGGQAASLGQDTTSNLTIVPNPPKDPNVIFFTTMTITYALGTETFTFNPNAGMALQSITDFSGNQTTYTYTDVYSPLNSTNLYAGLFGSPDFALYYSDPTIQTDALLHNKVFHYGDASHFRVMDSMVDEDNRLRTYAVDALGRRTNELVYTSDINSPVVQETDFEYSAAFPGVITKKTAKKLNGPNWSTDLVTQYVLDENGRVSQQIVDPNGLALTTTYTYDRNGNKLSITDAEQRTTSFEYSVCNRLTRIINPDGSAKSLAYDTRGNKVKETDENGHVTIATYDGLNRPTSKKRCLSSGDLITQYGYNNAVDPVSSITDPKNNVISVTYDSIQRPLTKTDALQHVTQFDYSGPNTGAHAFDSSNFKPTKVTDPRGYQVLFQYDVLYRTTRRKVQYQLAPALFADTCMTYDNVGNATNVKDPLQHSATVAYDALNRPVHTTYADTHDTWTFYTPTGLKWKVQDELGRQAATQYDGAGRPVLAIEPPVDDGLNPEQADRQTHMKCPKTQMLYDRVGNVVGKINPLLQEWDYVYDVRNRPIEVDQPAVADPVTGQPVRPAVLTGYDYVGNVLWVQDARGFTTETNYDEANRPLVITAPPVLLLDGTQPVRPQVSKTYDKNSNVLTVTDANGHVTTNTYDELNRLGTTTDAANITVTYAYDEVGNRISVKDGLSQETKLAYDGMNRNTTVTDAAQHLIIMNFDGMNQISRMDARGLETDYGYDARNRLLNVTYPASPAENQTYGYDAAGKLLSVVEPGKSGIADVAYTYDALSRLTSETSNGATHTYRYDLAGNRLGVQYGLAGGGNARSITSTYDALNRLSTMTDGGLVTSYTYDLGGNNVGQVLPNGDVVTQRYDGLNRMFEKETTSARGVVYHSISLTDAGGNVRRLQEYTAGVAPRTVTLGYDNDDRLTDEKITDLNGSVISDTAYDYDNANNRAHKTLNGNVASYSYNNLNQLTGWSDTQGNGASYTYDLNGNRATRSSGGATDTYSYDTENRLIGLVKNTAGGSGTYGYDYDYRTRRVSRREGSDTAKIVFSGGTSVQEYNSTGSLSAEFIRGSDWGGGVGGILYSVRGGTPSFAHYDQRGDVAAHTDSSGTVTWEASYEAFGSRPAEYGATQDRQKANTKEEDPDGLLNEGMRYRDLETGTFITRDPAGFVDGPNLYAYVRQNPWTHFDPQGLDEEDDGSGDDGGGGGDGGWDGGMDSTMQQVGQELSTDLSALLSSTFWNGVGTDAMNTAQRLASGIWQAALTGSDIIGYTAASIGGFGDQYEGNSQLFQDLAAHPENYNVDQLQTDILIGGLKAERNLATLGLWDTVAGTYTAITTGNFQSMQDASLNMLLLNLGLREDPIVGNGKGPIAGYDPGASAPEGGASDGAKAGGAKDWAPSMNCFVAGTIIATSDGAAPIESIHLGDRVLTSTSADQASNSDVRPGEWRKVQLRMANADISGDSFEIEVLRPVTWILQTRCVEGEKIELDLPEMGVKATAEVLKVGPCCEIKSGVGRVVLGTFTHTHLSVFRLRLEDGSEIESTGGHPFYSATRDTWIEARFLRPGEYLKTQTGELQISKIENLPVPRRVFNIQVEGDHRYYVSSSRVLVHNESPWADSGTVKDAEIIIDENLSPTLVSRLMNEGYVATKLAQGLSDQEIIDYAKQIGATVMTNNTADFVKQGIPVISVPTKLTSRAAIPRLINSLNSVKDVPLAPDTVVRLH